MADKSRHNRRIWTLVRRQHGVISRRQLLSFGFTSAAIHHRIATGRLHRTPFRGVYAVGRPELSELGRWMAAVLSCGPGAYLSHHDAAALYRIRRPHDGPVHVTVRTSARSRRGIVVHRRPNMQPGETTKVNGIPVTKPLTTLIDLAASTLGDRQLEAAINEADKLELLHAHRIPSLVDAVSPTRRGANRLKTKARTHKRTDSDLERAFLRIFRKHGVPMPQTQVVLEGGRVDFYWPEFDLIVEIDHSRFHRTPIQQASDRRRDRVHAAVGRTTLRFADTDADDPTHVVSTLRVVMARRAA